MSNLSGAFQNGLTTAAPHQTINRPINNENQGQQINASSKLLQNNYLTQSAPQQQQQQQLYQQHPPNANQQVPQHPPMQMNGSDHHNSIITSPSHNPQNQINKFQNAAATHSVTGAPTLLAQPQSLPSFVGQVQTPQQQQPPPPSNVSYNNTLSSQSSPANSVSQQLHSNNANYTNGPPAMTSNYGQGHPQQFQQQQQQNLINKNVGPPPPPSNVGQQMGTTQYNGGGAPKFPSSIYQPQLVPPVPNSQTPNINTLIPNLQNISLAPNHPPQQRMPPLTTTPQHGQVNNNPPGPLPPPPTSQFQNAPQPMKAATRPLYPPPVTQQQQPQSGAFPGSQYPQQMQYKAPEQYPAQPQQQQQPHPPNVNYYNGQQPQQSGFGPTQPNTAPLSYQPQQTTPAPQGIVQSGFSRMWGHPEAVDLMQQRHILPHDGVQPPQITLNNQFSDSVNCDPDIFRCTLSKIPESNSLLQKSRLPLGLLIHPFRDLENLPVISCSQIVRCRACRTYINPFVYFVDSKKWKCNLCYRVNELPDEFHYDPLSKSYGDVTRRPEVRSSTIEFIAPSEYMLRPPQPAIYLFLLDVSMVAVQSGYLNVVCDGLAEHLDTLPGDARTQIGFIAYNSSVHFYSIAEGYNRPHEITILDLEDIFMPRPDNLLINLKENRELINDLLDMLPKRFENSHDSGSALGAALQVAFKMMSATGGRVSVFQTCLPNKGPGALQSREDPNNRSAKDVNHLGPATDFYKRMALEYSGQQIAADLFLLNCQYSDLSTLSGISKFSGGCIYHFPLFNIVKKQDCIMFRKCFERYLTRKIGFEAVMRVRCTRGLAIHTFHGNFFVRSTDLLSLPNVNPDSGFGMQITYEESLTELRSICFQAALLYTSSKGERRIRVHTLCLPVVNTLTEVIASADSQCIIGLLCKMAVDRSIQASLTDARDAFINATVDILTAYRVAQNLPHSAAGGQVMAPMNLSLLPLYILALLKNVAFRTGTSTRLDDRIYAMCELKSLPLDHLMKYIYPELYRIDSLCVQNENNETVIPPLLQLSAETLDSRSMFLMDTGPKIYIYVGSNVPQQILKNVIGVSMINEIPDLCFDLQTIDTVENERLHSFIEALNKDKPYKAVIQIIRDTSTTRPQFTEKFVDDRTESSLSYYEFLQHLRTQVK